MHVTASTPRRFHVTSRNSRYLSERGIYELSASFQESLLSVTDTCVSASPNITILTPAFQVLIFTKPTNLYFPLWILYIHFTHPIQKRCTLSDSWAFDWVKITCRLLLELGSYWTTQNMSWYLTVILIRTPESFVNFPSKKESFYILFASGFQKWKIFCKMSLLKNKCLEQTFKNGKNKLISMAVNEKNGHVYLNLFNNSWW